MNEHIGHKRLHAPGELIQDVSPNRFSRCCPEFFMCETCEKRWPSSTFFHVFRILTLHSVFHEPVRGSQNAGRAVIYAAALWCLAHSQCGKYSACALRLRVLHYLYCLVCFLCSGQWDFHILCGCILFINIYTYIYIYISPRPLP